jgi:hypothetical protein
MDHPACGPEHGCGLGFLFTAPAGLINKLRIIEALELLLAQHELHLVDMSVVQWKCSVDPPDKLHFTDSERFSPPDI